MDVICEACGYPRQSSDQCPDWQCPSCGKAYSKTSHDPHGSPLRQMQIHPAASGTPLVKPLITGATYEPSPDGLIVGACIVGTILATIVGLFLGKTSSPLHWPWVALMVLMPWIGAVAVHVWRDSLLDQMGRDTLFLLCVSLVMLVIGIDAIAAQSSLAFEYSRALHKGFMFAIPFLLACSFVALRLHNTTTQRYPWLSWPMLMVAAYLYGGASLALANRWFDHSRATAQETTVIGKFVSRGGRSGTRYTVVVAPWSSIPDSNRLDVKKTVYEAIKVGQSRVCVVTHPGAFDLTWGTEAPCAGRPSAGS